MSRPDDSALHARKRQNADSVLPHARLVDTPTMLRWQRLAKIPSEAVKTSLAVTGIIGAVYLIWNVVWFVSWVSPARVTPDDIIGWYLQTWFWGLALLAASPALLFFYGTRRRDQHSTPYCLQDACTSGPHASAHGSICQNTTQFLAAFTQLPLALRRDPTVRHAYRAVHQAVITGLSHDGYYAEARDAIHARTNALVGLREVRKSMAATAAVLPDNDDLQTLARLIESDRHALQAANRQLAAAEDDIQAALDANSFLRKDSEPPKEGRTVPSWQGPSGTPEDYHRTPAQREIIRNHYIDKHDRVHGETNKPLVDCPQCRSANNRNEQDLWRD